jgi:hypothetical protein
MQQSAGEPSCQPQGRFHHHIPKFCLGKVSRIFCYFNFTSFQVFIALDPRYIDYLTAALVDKVFCFYIKCPKEVYFLQVNFEKKQFLAAIFANLFGFGANSG